MTKIKTKMKHIKLYEDFVNESRLSITEAEKEVKLEKADLLDLVSKYEAIHAAREKWKDAVLANYKIYWEASAARSSGESDKADKLEAIVKKFNDSQSDKEDALDDSIENKKTKIPAEFYKKFGYGINEFGTPEESGLSDDERDKKSMGGGSTAIEYILTMSNKVAYNYAIYVTDLAIEMKKLKMLQSLSGLSKSFNASTLESYKAIIDRVKVKIDGLKKDMNLAEKDMKEAIKEFEDKELSPEDREAKAAKEREEEDARGAKAAKEREEKEGKEISAFSAKTKKWKDSTEDEKTAAWGIEKYLADSKGESLDDELTEFDAQPTKDGIDFKGSHVYGGDLKGNYKKGVLDLDIDAENYLDGIFRKPKGYRIKMKKKVDPKKVGTEISQTLRSINDQVARNDGSDAKKRIKSMGLEIFDANGTKVFPKD